MPASRKPKASPGATPEEVSPLLPMEARIAERLPDEAGWQYEPKWDGFRCLAFKSGGVVLLFSKSGKPLHRYFPEVVENVTALAGEGFILDGELAIAIGDTLSFDALQLRLHPAQSRIDKLSQQTPAMFVLFDMLARDGGESLVAAPLSDRRAALEQFFSQRAGARGIRLSPYTRDITEAQGWLDRAGGAMDGVVAKRVDGAYESGERAMVKVKRIRSADCVVGGFRYGTNEPLVGSLLLGLFNAEGLLDHVGFTSTISKADREALTRRLEALVGGPGFTGKAPGGPSRWSTERSGEFKSLRHELVVEVTYDHATGDRFRHGTKLLRWRPDKAPASCTFDQLEHEASPGKLARHLVEG